MRLFGGIFDYTATYTMLATTSHKTAIYDT